MPPKHIKAALEILPHLSASDPRARELASLYLAENGYKLDDIEGELAEMEGSTFVVARDNGHAAIAVAALRHRHDDQEADILHVATRSDHHREGLGTQVMQKLTEIATQSGLTRLHVRPGPGSYEFYRSQGFEDDPRRGSWLIKDLSPD